MAPPPSKMSRKSKTTTKMSSFSLNGSVKEEEEEIQKDKALDFDPFERLRYNPSSSSSSSSRRENFGEETSANIITSSRRQPSSPSPPPPPASIVADAKKKRKRATKVSSLPLDGNAKGKQGACNEKKEKGEALPKALDFDPFEKFRYNPPPKPRRPPVTGPSPIAAYLKKMKSLRPKRINLKKVKLKPYERVPDDHPWVPPRSHFGLLQEYYFQDPWKILVICMLCNRTRGSQAGEVLHELFSLCPSAEAAVDTPVELICEVIKKLGLQNKRSHYIKNVSKAYLCRKWTHVTQLPYVGKYGADSYAIFCSGYWKEVIPNDHKLVDYWKYMHRMERRAALASLRSG